MKNEIIKIAKELEQGAITETEARTLLLGLFGVSGSYSDWDIRDMMLEMHNEAITGLRNEQRWDMQKRLGAIRDKWKLGV